LLSRYELARKKIVYKITPCYDYFKNYDTWYDPFTKYQIKCFDKAQSLKDKSNMYELCLYANLYEWKDITVGDCIQCDKPNKFCLVSDCINGIINGDNKSCVYDHEK